jgi:hypothetical protein
VPEHGDAYLLVEFFLQHALHVTAADVVAIPVARALSQDHDAIAAASLASRLEALGQHILPVLHIWRRFGDEHPVRATGQCAHQRQVAAVAPHDLHDKRPLVTGRRAGDGIHGFGEAMQRRVGADGDVGSGEIVVDRADQSHDGQVGIGRDFVRLDLSRLSQLGNKRRPLLSKDVRAGQ